MFHQYHPSVQRTLGLYHYDFCHWFQDNSTHFWKCSHRNCLEMPCCIQASSTVLKKLALVAQMSHLCLLESEAVRHKLKNSQKMHFWYFLAVFELLSDSLTATYVELHRCPSHHSILLTQGLISEIFAKKFWELAILKNELFLSRPFWIFFSKKKFFFLLHSHENQPKFIWKNGWVKILIFSLVSRKLFATLNITLYIVYLSAFEIGHLNCKNLLFF